MNTENEILDVVYCLDENYNIQMTTSANSFLQCYKGPVRIHLLHSNPESLDELVKLLQPFENLISVQKYKFTKNKDFSFFSMIDDHHVTEATYYRLFIHQYLPNSISKLLYLDPDVIAMQEITKVIEDTFNELKSSKHSVAAVNYIESSNSTNQEMLNRLNMDSKKYFNAGVMFIDYKKWLHFEIGKKILLYSKEIISKNIELKEHDQDILNSYFDGKFYELEINYNYPILERFFKKDKKRIENESFFIHYVGKEKPWLLNGIFCNIAKYYQNSFGDLNNGIHFVNDESVDLKKIFKKFKFIQIFNLIKLFRLIRVLKKHIYL